MSNFITRTVAAMMLLGFPKILKFIMPNVQGENVANVKFGGASSIGTVFNNINSSGLIDIVSSATYLLGFIMLTSALFALKSEMEYEDGSNNKSNKKPHVVSDKVQNNQNEEQNTINEVQKAEIITKEVNKEIVEEKQLKILSLSERYSAVRNSLNANLKYKSISNGLDDILTLYQKIEPSLIEKNDLNISIKRVYEVKLIESLESFLKINELSLNKQSFEELEEQFININLLFNKKIIEMQEQGLQTIKISNKYIESRVNE